MINGLFDVEFRLEKIDKNGDPLVQLNKIIDWKMFSPQLDKLRQKEHKSNAGAKGYDSVMMFKVLVLQSLYGLSDDAMEAQILDRITFMRFLGLNIGGKVPDAKTIWVFRQQLTEAGIIDDLFAKFDEHLRQNGFSARKGQIIDASIVEVPRQRNTRDENEKIKNSETPEGWSDVKSRQKDVDARWLKKNGHNYYGYKNHIEIDAAHKFIRSWDVTSAEVHDSNIFEVLLDKTNSSRDVWADSAYRTPDILETLKKNGFREHVQRKGCRNRKLTAWEKQGNRTRSKTRSRVEHVFGIQSSKTVDKMLRCIGKLRAYVQIGLRNLAFNLARFVTLTSSSKAQRISSLPCKG
jgi:transposase, IS5 family